MLGEGVLADVPAARGTVPSPTPSFSADAVRRARRAQAGNLEVRERLDPVKHVSEVTPGPSGRSCEYRDLEPIGDSANGACRGLG